MTFVLPLIASGARRLSAVHALILAGGFVSYGVQFELEGGRFNFLAVALSFISIRIYHYRGRYRILAYLLFLISVPLQLYPLIFSLMLMKDWRDWRDWRDNLRRLILLGLATIAVLFTLGSGIFRGLIGAIRRFSATPPLWIHNHSIRAFVYTGLQRPTQRGWTLPNTAGSIL